MSLLDSLTMDYGQLSSFRKSFQGTHIEEVKLESA